MLYIFEQLEYITAREELSFYAQMPIGRQKKYDSYVRHLDKKLCVISYRLLHSALIREFNKRELPVIGTEKGGKPVLVNMPEAHFCISHCGCAVVVALSSAPVGVDVETISRFQKILSKDNNFVSKVLTNKERLLFDNAAAEDKALILCEAWTRKESILKQKGAPAALSNLKKTDTWAKSAANSISFGKFVVSVAGPEAAKMHVVKVPATGLTTL